MDGYKFLFAVESVATAPYKFINCCVVFIVWLLHCIEL